MPKKATAHFNLSTNKPGNMLCTRWWWEFDQTLSSRHESLPTDYSPTLPLPPHTHMHPPSTSAQTHLLQYWGPIGGLKWSYVGNVSTQDTVDAATLVTDQNPTVNGGPLRVWGRRRGHALKSLKNLRLIKFDSLPGVLQSAQMFAMSKYFTRKSPRQTQVSTNGV